LGEPYSKLYTIFGTEFFTFKDATTVLHLSKAKLAIILSKLHRYGMLMVFKQRPRIYRTLDPENFFLLTAEKVQDIPLQQELYKKVVFDAFRLISARCTLISFALYGSIARGTAVKISDIDILLIADDFTGSISSRIDMLASIEDTAEVRKEISWLMKQGVYTTLNFLPLTRNELSQFPILLLDLTEDAKILFDKDQFLEALLLRFQARLQLKGARRIKLENGRWYWDLKPNYKCMEPIEI